MVTQYTTLIMLSIVSHLLKGSVVIITILVTVSYMGICSQRWPKIPIHKDAFSAVTILWVWVVIALLIYPSNPYNAMFKIVNTARLQTIVATATQASISPNQDPATNKSQTYWIASMAIMIVMYVTKVTTIHTLSLLLVAFLCPLFHAMSKDAFIACSRMYALNVPQDSIKQSILTKT